MYKRPKARESQIVTVPAPTKGLNDLDSLANMDPLYALELMNLFPGQSSLQVRAGYIKWASGLASMGETLISYNAALGDELFVASDNGIFDITTAGAVGAAVTALTNGRGSYVNFANIAAQYLVFVNGTDAGKLYDGTTWINFTTVGAPVNPGEVSGANMADMIQVKEFKKRLWFVEKNSMSAWYLPTDAVAGAMTEFLLGSVFSRGGFLQNIFSWSLDAGDGMDDLLIFQSSKGEIAIYAGTDPTSATTFALESVYFVGAPLGDRTATDLGGDTAMMGIFGLVPMSAVVGGQQALTSYENALSKNISRTLNRIVRSRVNNPGWEVLNAPNFQALFINFPALPNIDATQYVMNTITGAWCQFDLPIRTLEMHGESVFFTDDLGNVFKYDGTEVLDNVNIDGSNGDVIISSLKQAHNYFGAPGVNKHYKLIRPLFVATYPPGYIAQLSVDFSPNGIFSVPSPPINPPATDVWDVAIWDLTLWSPEQETQFEWIGVEGLGYCASLVMKMATNVATELVSIDWAYAPSNSI